MLTLAAGETIAGVASLASSITYTFFGMELNAGVEAYKTLAQGQLPAAAATLYTAAASTEVFFKSIHLVNVTAFDVSGVKLYQTGTTSGKQITGNMTIPANGWATFEEDGWRIYNAAGELLQKISGTGVALVGTFPFDTYPQFSGDGFLYGLPGFTPINTSTYSFPGTQKSVVQPFRVKSRVTIAELYINVQQARTTCGLRYMIYKANFVNGLIVSLGSKVYDSGLDSTSGITTGTKTIASVNTVLEQGNYALVIAQNNTGTGAVLILKTLTGSMEGNELAVPSGGNWRANSELGYTGADYATTPVDPWSGTLVAALTTYTPTIGAGVSYPMLVGMKYQFTNPLVSVGAGGSAAGSGHNVTTSYQFSSTTTDADPGAGKFRFNVAVANSSYDFTMFINTADLNSVDMSSFFDGFTPSIFSNVMFAIYSTVDGQTKRLSAKIVSRTTGVGYRKFGIKVLHKFDGAPPLADADVLTIVWEPARRHITSLPPITGQATFNLSASFSIPGFIPQRAKTKTLSAGRGYCVPFVIRQPIYVKTLRFIVTAAPTVSTARALVYEMAQRTADGLHDAALKVLDSGAADTTILNSTGIKQMALGNKMLAPGYYYAVLAIGAGLTGTLSVNALNGIFADGPPITISANAWQAPTEMYFGTDLTAGPANYQNPPNVNAAALSTTGFSDQFDAPFVLEWEGSM